MLWLSGVVAHAIAQGGFIEIRSVIVLSILIFAPLLLVLPKVCTGPALAAIVALSQFAGHVVLGGSDNNSNFMLVTHIAVGFVTYFGIEHLDALLTSLGQFTRAIFVRYISWAPIVVIRQQTVRVNAEIQIWVSHLDSRAVCRRGPPLFA